MLEPHAFPNPGHLPSPPDPRDFTLKKVNRIIGAAVPAPPTYFTDLSSVPVLMQSHQPSCIGHATAAGMMYEDNGAYSYDYSPRFLYALAKRDDGIPQSEGTYYRQALKEAKQFGVADNAQFPNDVTLDPAVYKDASLIPQTAFDVAKSRLVKSYVAVTDLSFDGIKNAIFQNKVVLLGVRLGDEWWTDEQGQTTWSPALVLPLRPPKKDVSGHAILAYGYDQNFIYFRNSWSKDWGRSGDGMFGSNYLPFIQEAWTFMDLAPEVVANLKQQLFWYQKVVQLLKQLLHLA